MVLMAIQDVNAMISSIAAVMIVVRRMVPGDGLPQRQSFMALVGFCWGALKLDRWMGGTCIDGSYNALRGFSWLILSIPVCTHNAMAFGSE